MKFVRIKTCYMSNWVLKYDKDILIDAEKIARIEIKDAKGTPYYHVEMHGASSFFTTREEAEKIFSIIGASI